MDYSKHRLNDWVWLAKYREERGKEWVDNYMNRVYQKLMDLPVGGSINIPAICEEKNIDLFIKTCCMFIISNPRYEMNSDYSIIRRL